MRNPYCCRLLRRIDKIVYMVKGRNPYWAQSGHLCERMKAGHGAELPTHFPGKWYSIAAKIQNRWPATRHILSW